MYCLWAYVSCCAQASLHTCCQNEYLCVLLMAGLSLPYHAFPLQVAEPRPEDLECLAKLLSTIGKQLDDNPNPTNREHMNMYFMRIQQLTRHDKLESRIRFMLQVGTPHCSELTSLWLDCCAASSGAGAASQSGGLMLQLRPLLCLLHIYMRLLGTPCITGDWRFGVPGAVTIS